MEAISLLSHVLTPLRSPLVAANLNPSQISLLVLVTGIGIILCVTARRRTRVAQNSPRAYAREQTNRIKEERRVQQEIGNVMVELEQLARQMHAAIETKFAKLEAAVRAADERIESLDRLLRRSEGRPTVDVTVADAHPPVPTTTSYGDRSRDRVFALADAGRTPVQIAQEIGQTVGEVELILALRKRSVARV